MLLYPVIQAFVDATAGGPPVDVTDIGPSRAGLEGLQGSTNPPLTVDHEIIAIPVGSSGSLNVHIYKPKGCGDLIPVLMHIHGGGWMLGSNITHQRAMMDLVNESGVAVFLPLYSLYPETSYPVPIEECYDVLQWLYANGKTHGLNTEKVAISGDSAGGQLSIAVNLLSLQRHTPVPKYHILFDPVTDISKDSRTYALFSEGPVLIPAQYKTMIEAWIPASRRTEILASPLLATKEDLKGFPETLIFTAEFDPLREEGEQFGRNLIAAGVEAAVFRALAVTHTATMFNLTASASAAKAELEFAGLKLKKALF